MLRSETSLFQSTYVVVAVDKNECIVFVAVAAVVMMTTTMMMTMMMKIETLVPSFLFLRIVVVFLLQLVERIVVLKMMISL